MVESPQGVQLFQRQDQCLRRGWVHEVKVDEVIDTQTLEQEHHISKVGPLDLCGGQEEGNEEDKSSCALLLP